MANNRYCTVDDWGKKYYSSGYCKIHYYRMYRTGTLTLDPKPTPEQLFWAKVDKSTDCWRWTACRSPDGYGRFVNKKIKDTLCHRIAYEFVIGPIPTGLQIRHLCNNGHLGCVNPHHMVPGTHSQNMIDRSYAGTLKRQKLSVEDVLVIRYALQTVPTAAAALAAAFGVSTATLQGAAVGRSYSHLPGAIKKRHTKKRHARND